MFGISSLCGFANHATPLQKEVETKVVHGNEAFNEAMLKENPAPWTKQQIMIYLFSLVGFFCSTMNGYDGSLINNLLGNPWFQEAFGTQSTGIWAGIVTSMYQIGGIVALPFVGPSCDYWGRRVSPPPPNAPPPWR